MFRIRPLGRAEVEMCPIKKAADEGITGIGVVCLESDWGIRRVLTMVKIREVEVEILGEVGIGR
jgi:hypothetical protein